MWRHEPLNGTEEKRNGAIDYFWGLAAGQQIVYAFVMMR